MQCFPNKPNNVNRSVIAQKLNRIRKFRNRVYHNEPICFDGQSANFSEAGDIRDEVFEILSWIDSDLLTYAEHFNGIKSKISQANNI
ncbi:MAG: hypothetical protein GDA37_03920 [Ekhidna sp.]|nr:hypothetical protein [Ekhidna sp.]